MNPYMINPNQKLDDTYRSGLILIIIGCSFAILTLILAIPAIITLVFAIKSLKYQTYRYKIVCGVMGLIFGFLLGIIGGILLLISDKTDQDDVIIIKQKDLK